MKKDRLKTHIYSFWPLYIIFSVVSILLWSTIVTFWTKDKKEEVVKVWVMSYGLDVSKMNEKLEENMPSYLKHVRTTFQDRKNVFIDMIYEGLGEGYDIAILPMEFIEKTNIEKTYCSLDERYFASDFYDMNYYEKEGVKYGIEIFDKGDEDDSLITYTKEGEERDNYYVFLNKNSLHFSEVNNSNYDGGLAVLKTLLEDKYGEEQRKNKGF